MLHIKYRNPESCTVAAYSRMASGNPSDGAGLGYGMHVDGLEWAMRRALPDVSRLPRGEFSLKYGGT